MGIPKFYRWLSERYPMVNQPIASTHVPVIDNLYLDMNGIIHNCTHGNDPNVKLTEDDMIVKVFAYIDRLFQIVQPQRLLFAAIDGCAPRAKMNQQRGRRFKAAKEAAENAAKQARENPDDGPRRDAFDSNCITPGTPFMGRLAAHLRFFFRKKIAEDPAWQKPLIIFSGHDVPGEGEHKIMEHIRWEKRQPGYEPNQRHCLYGLDADLIMLSLVSHEPHFCLLREAVSFGGGGKGQPSREVLANPQKEHFILFQIGLLREYMELEFSSANLGFPFDIERFVDDFVLFCMLIGNDFLPTLPTLDVNEGALDSIFAIYKRLLPQMGGYLTEAGQLNLLRLEMLLKDLAALELETLEQRAADAEYFENKRQGGRGRGGPSSYGNGRPASQGAARPTSNGASRNAFSELDEDADTDAQLAKLMGELGGADDLSLLAALEDEAPAKPVEPTMMSKEARALVMSGQGAAGLQLWKERYYSEKLELDARDPRAVRSAVVAFVQGLFWVLEYYYRGVVSWGWFYPFHYSPMISDMTDLQEIRAEFERGQPFTPYQQLLAVLPAASHKLLPRPYQWLMTDSKSPISDFYPLNFTLDTEGKRQEWEAVVVLKFIDVPRLRQAESLIPADHLTPEEQQRNKPGPLLHFFYDSDSEEMADCTSTLPCSIPSVPRSRSRCQEHEPLPPIPDGEPGFQPRLVPGTVTGKGGPPGFPTMRTLKLIPELKMAAVEVLGQPSKRESLVLSIEASIQAGAAAASAGQVAKGLIGERIWIKWPYLQEAIIQAVSDGERKIGQDKSNKVHNKDEADEWRRAATQLTHQFRTKQGLEIGACNLVLHVRPCEGLMRQLDGTIEKRFSKAQAQYPIQATLKHNPSPDPRLDPACAAGAGRTHSFEANSRAIFVGKAHYGCLATVLPSDGMETDGGSDRQAAALRILIEPLPPAAFTAIQTAKRIVTGFQVNYMPSYQVARKLGISPRCLSMLTSSVHVRVDDKRLDVGLCIKNAPRGLCVPDYVKPQPEQQGWLYSPSLVQLLEKFKGRHLWVIKAIEGSSEARGDLDASNIFPGQSTEERLQLVLQAKGWLNAQALSRRVLVKTTATVASEQAIRALQQALPPALTRKQEPVELDNVSPMLLLAPNDASSIPSELSGGTFVLGDRVAFLGRSGLAPLAAQGTVVGVHDDDCEVLFDSPFTGGNDLQGRCHGNCGAVVSAEDLLNLTTPHAVPNLPHAMVSSKQQQRAPPRTPHTGQVAAQPSLVGVAKQGNGALSGEKTPPSNTWLGQRRNLETDLTAAAASLAGLAVAENAAIADSKAASRVGKDRLARKVLDPPQNGHRGFSLGRGRQMAPPKNTGEQGAANARVGADTTGQGVVFPPAHSVAPAPAVPQPPPPGLLPPQSAAPPGLGQNPSAHPLLLALQANQQPAESLKLEHKVHHGMGAARAFLRLSQQNLVDMDTAPSAGSAGPEPHSTQPAQQGPSAGSHLLSMLQGTGASSQPSAEMTESTSTFTTAARATEMPSGPGSSRPADTATHASTGEASLLSWLALEGSIANAAGMDTGTLPGGVVPPNGSLRPGLGGLPSTWASTAEQLGEQLGEGAGFWDKAPAAVQDRDVDARFAGVQRPAIAPTAQPSSDEQAFWNALSLGRLQPQRPRSSAQQPGQQRAPSSGGAALLSMLRQPSAAQQPQPPPPGMQQPQQNVPSPQFDRQNLTNGAQHPGAKHRNLSQPRQPAYPGPPPNMASVSQHRAFAGTAHAPGLFPQKPGPPPLAGTLESQTSSRPYEHLLPVHGGQALLNMLQGSGHQTAGPPLRPRPTSATPAWQARTDPGVQAAGPPRPFVGVQDLAPGAQSSLGTALQQTQAAQALLQQQQLMNMSRGSMPREDDALRQLSGAIGWVHRDASPTDYYNKEAIGLPYSQVHPVGGQRQHYPSGQVQHRPPAAVLQSPTRHPNAKPIGTSPPLQTALNPSGSPSAALPGTLNQLLSAPSFPGPAGSQGGAGALHSVANTPQKTHPQPVSHSDHSQAAPGHADAPWIQQFLAGPRSTAPLAGQPARPPASVRRRMEPVTTPGRPSASHPQAAVVQARGGDSMETDSRRNAANSPGLPEPMGVESASGGLDQLWASLQQRHLQESNASEVVEGGK